MRQCYWPSTSTYDAKTLNPGWMQGGVGGPKYTRSPNGWIDTELFHIWIKDHFLPQQATFVDP